MKARFLLAAVTELEEAFDYYLSRSVQAARDFHSEAMRAVGEIEGAPNRWPELEPGIRRYRLKRFDYAIIYRIRTGHVELIAVAHLARQPGYWRSRLGP